MYYCQGINGRYERTGKSDNIKKRKLFIRLPHKEKLSFYLPRYVKCI